MFPGDGGMGAGEQGKVMRNSEETKEGKAEWSTTIYKNGI